MRQSRIRGVPLHAVLLPLMPAVWIFASNATRLTVWHGVLTALVLLGGYLAVREALQRILRRHPMTDPTLAASFLVLTCPLYLYGRDALVAPFVAVVVAVVVASWLHEAPRRALSIALAVMPSTIIAVNGLAMMTLPVWSQRAGIEKVVRNAGFHSDAGLVATRQESRDIYYLVFDRYGRADQLQSIHGYDNEPFLEALRQRGFVVADRAYANYQRTTHSLASSLNFDYLDELDTDATRGSPDWLPLYGLLDDTRVVRFLKAQGYRFHFLGGWWEPTRTNGRADVVHNWYSAPEALRTLYEHSMIVRMARSAGITRLDPLWMQCRRTQQMFARLAAIDDKAPRFVFAHFLVPHPPYVVHESGRCMGIEEARSRSRTENYVGQIRYVNESVLSFVDQVLSRPGPRPIVILQADEGPWPAIYARDEITRLGGDVSEVDWRRTTSDDLREKMAILSAYYLPDDPRDPPPAHATPVNTFRRILATYFGVAIDLLPDRHYVYQTGRDLYRFSDVTAKLSVVTTPETSAAR